MALGRGLSFSGESQVNEQSMASMSGRWELLPFVGGSLRESSFA